MNWFNLANVDDKISHLPSALTEALGLSTARHDFQLARDVEVVHPQLIGGRMGLATPEGQARLLHDLANIELQAMELAMRTLSEFPEAPRDFRFQLADIAVGEARHLGLCLREMRRLGFDWGHWRVHTSLWTAAGPEDSLIDRILIVHRYLEAAGLDAGESILRRLMGADAPSVRSVVKTIVHEEVDHVQFGSRWYHRIAQDQLLDVERDFETRITKISKLIPRREKLARELRKQAGFTEFEINVLENASANLG